MFLQLHTVCRVGLHQFVGLGLLSSRVLSVLMGSSECSCHSKVVYCLDWDIFMIYVLW